MQLYGSKSIASQVTETASICAPSPLTYVGFSDLCGWFQLSPAGSTFGIGAEMARFLAKRGVRLVLPVRNLEADEDVKASIVSECPESKIVVMSLDLSRLSSLGYVRNFVSKF